jgi:hypothetical protein
MYTLYIGKQCDERDREVILVVSSLVRIKNKNFMNDSMYQVMDSFSLDFLINKRTLIHLRISIYCICIDFCLITANCRFDSLLRADIIFC